MAHTSEYLRLPVKAFGELRRIFLLRIQPGKGAQNNAILIQEGSTCVLSHLSNTMADHFTSLQCQDLSAEEQNVLRVLLVRLLLFFIWFMGRPDGHELGF